MKALLRSVALIAATGVAGETQQPVVHRIVVAPAETLHVTVQGRGDNLVIIPGIWSLTYGFRKLIPPLVAQGFRVTVIEPLGMASSSRPRSSDYSMTAQARRINAALDSMRLGPAIFIGQALATSMLLRAELQSPGRMSGMVSLEGDASEESATPGLRRGLAMASFFFRVFPSDALMKRRLRGSLENVSGDKSWITPEVVNGYMTMWSGRVVATLDTYRAMARSKEPDSLGPRVRTIDLPVHLLLGGAPHFGAPGEQGLARFRALPALRVTTVPGGGHLVHEERPDVVVDAVVRMRRQISGDR